MRRFVRTTGSLLLLAVTLLLGPAAWAARLPNIVVMLTDDQRWDAMGVVQRELGARARFSWFGTATPNMDRLAAEGFRFTNAFVVSALCSPSRAAFLTGRYNHLNGVIDNSTPFPLDSVTYASMLRAAGYRTGLFGKWHMGFQRERPGFDEYASFVEHGTYFDAPMLIDGVETPTVGWVDDVSTDHAVQFINRNAHRPFLVVLAFKSPHGPPYPPPRVAGRFARTTVAPPPNALSYAPYDPTPVQNPAPWLLAYFRTLVAVDQNVGRVLSALDARGIANDTVVVYASDNGFFMGEHGITARKEPDGNKRNAYEESIRIPLLVRYPRLLRRGVVLSAQALNIDLAPTLLELAGVARPAGMQGISWVPLLEGRTTTLRSRFLYEYFHEAPWTVPTMVALRRSAFKLIQYPGHPEWEELFRLSDDPYERNNLARNPAFADLRRSMVQQLAAEQRATGYRIPPGIGTP